MVPDDADKGRHPGTPVMIKTPDGRTYNAFCSFKKSFEANYEGSTEATKL
jgi:hypothetical protein